MRISAIFRIAIALAGAVVGILLTTYSLKFFPDEEAQRQQSRNTVVENVAVQCCLAAQRNDRAMLEAILEALHTRNPEIVSAGIRRGEGACAVVVGSHEVNWRNDSTEHRLSKSEVPIYSGKKQWGKLEICYLEPETPFFGLLSGSARAILFVAAVAFLVFVLYLKRMLQYLDPAAVVPDRVRQALDTLAEGVVIVDPHERIVLANRAFSKNMKVESEALMGRRLGDLGFNPTAESEANDLPWQQALQGGETPRGVMLRLKAGDQGDRTFAVNCTPIRDEKGAGRGALATFDDVTVIEKKNEELQDMLQVVKLSREEIRRQNEVLTEMATCDVLTGCFNRRHLFSHLEKIWADRSGNGSITCIMLDIDHFKSVNDNHGHAKGDSVLQEVAARLKSAIGPNDLLARYGGEEFCVVSIGQSLEATAELAERLRVSIAASPVAELKISSSFGVTGAAYGARQPAELIDQADKALYFSKQNGRNQVTCYPNLPADFSVAFKKPAEETSIAEPDVPFHAVTALLTALLYRDSRTADHSRRVADIAAAVGRKFLSQKDCYILEVAALLHDIGKVGVPDAILLKPGPLTPEEWEVMKMHDRIGVEIIHAAFNCPRLSEIIRTHHAWFGGNTRDSELPTGGDICIEARILSVSDAYDAIVSDRVYRRGRSHDEAVVELRRCTGKQFDEKVVDALVDALDHRPELASLSPTPISKSAALQIGLHIERLATAADARDVKQLSVVAERLCRTATYVGFEPIAQAAQMLAQSAANEPELNEMVRLTGELLDLCRSTQSAFLKSETVMRPDSLPA
jgi:diguanylate cyclase (GGDEF)-like protein/PAS domain S-box-containing protein/putative nucleotidyltransferase with HDIG domain